jgi:hypothetical protein
LLYTTGRFRKLSPFHREQDVSVYKMVYKRVNRSPRGMYNLKSKDMLIDIGAIIAIVFIARFTIAFHGIYIHVQNTRRVLFYLKR